MKHVHGFKLQHNQILHDQTFFCCQLISDPVVELHLHFLSGLSKYHCPRNDWKL